MWTIELVGGPDSIYNYVREFSNTLADIESTTWENAKRFTSEFDAYKWAKNYCTGRNYKIRYHRIA